MFQLLLICEKQKFKVLSWSHLSDIALAKLFSFASQTEKMRKEIGARKENLLLIYFSDTHTVLLSWQLT